MRAHYLDDEIRGRKYMQSVGPASYETLNKQVTMPANLRANVAPVVIEKEMKDKLRLSSETAIDKRLLASNDTSLQDIVRLEPQIFNRKKSGEQPGDREHSKENEDARSAENTTSEV